MAQQQNESVIYWRFTASIVVTLLICLTAIFGIVSMTNRKLIAEQAKVEAKALFASIVMARKWNALYNGVYVEKLPGRESNPFLPGSDILTADGRIFIKKNPATMTREISELAGREGLFTFHITSLVPLNPANRADAFEAQALQAFEQGHKDFSRVEQRGGRRYLRFMAPLLVDAECLQCHAAQGYKIGDVRGGISVSIDIAEIERNQKANTLTVVFAGFVSTSALLGLVLFFTYRLMRRIIVARSLIERMALQDELTGLFSRRHLMSRFDEEFERAKRRGNRLSCIMLDIDHFKTINDSFGHLAGDAILKEIAELLRTSARAYDICGRYGGEEFLIVLPDTGAEEAVQVAERTRAAIKEFFVSTTVLEVRYAVTVSFGVTALADSDSSIRQMIKRADDALYQAKREGRDRVALVTA